MILANHDSFASLPYVCQVYQSMQIDLCQEGQAEVCYQIADKLRSPLQPQAYLYLFKACTHGLSQSCIDLASLLEKSLQEHEQKYVDRSSCDTIISGIQLEHFESFFKAQESSQDSKLSLYSPRYLDRLIKELLEMSCFNSKANQQQGTACFNLANYTAMPNQCSIRQPNWSQALNYLLKSCELQTAEACWALGQRALTSPWQLRQQCLRGNQQSCALINHDIFQKYDPLSQARFFLDRACQANLIESCIPLSLLYFHGRGGVKDLAEVKRLTQKLCLAKQKNISEQACRWHQELSHTK